MTTSQRYPHAPITEAIIDIRVELPPDFGVERLTEVQQGLENTYPTRADRRMASFEGQVVGDSAAATATTQHVGYIFASGDHRQVFQARLDGFSLSRLAPYESWEPFRDEARRIWNKYRSVAPVNRVARLAVRYVNRIDIPLPIDDLKTYLRTAPEVSPDLPQNLVGYFMQLRVPLGDIQATLLINQAVVPPAKSNVVSIVLDNDLFRSEVLPSAEEDIWSFIEVLRTRKNDVFEACITNRTRELFQ